MDSRMINKTKSSNSLGTKEGSRKWKRWFRDRHALHWKDRLPGLRFSCLTSC